MKDDCSSTLAVSGISGPPADLDLPFLQMLREMEIVDEEKPQEVRERVFLFAEK